MLYFQMSPNIAHLLKWKSCAGVELLVNVDSTDSADRAWLDHGQSSRMSPPVAPSFSRRIFTRSGASDAPSAPFSTRMPARIVSNPLSSR